MKRFVEGAERGQSTLFPECLEDWIDEDNPVRVIDVFVDTLDLTELGFEGVEPAETGRPAYHPSVLLKLYVYGYLNRVQALLVQRGGDCSGQARDVNGAEASGAALAPVVG
jgi:transposase